MSDEASDVLTREQVILGSKTLRQGGQARLALKDWIPPTDFRVTDELVLGSIDNLDMYARKNTRIIDGVVKSSRMVHAVVSERILFDRELLDGPAPDGDLLFTDTGESQRASSIRMKGVCGQIRW